MRHLLNDVCDIYRMSTTTTDSWGSTGGAFEVVSANMPVRMVQRRRALEVEFSGTVYPVQMVAWIPYGTVMETGDRLLCKGRWFQVLGWNDDAAGRGYYIEAWVREIR